MSVSIQNSGLEMTHESYVPRINYLSSRDLTGSIHLWSNIASGNEHWLAI